MDRDEDDEAPTSAVFAERGSMPSLRPPPGRITIQFEPTDVAELLTSSLKPLVAEAALQGIELRVESSGDLPRFLIDREKVAWAITALVGNALRYIRRGPRGFTGGKITVHLAHDAAEREIGISVGDDGPGISPERAPSLFARSPGANHAVGLALSLMRDVVAAHGGRIGVESRTEPMDHGTTIRLFLPASVHSA